MDEGRYTEIRAKLMEQFDGYRDVDDDEIYDRIDRLILQENRRRFISLEDRLALRVELYNSIRRLDILQELVDRNEITEIMVNGTEGIFIEEKGRIKRWEKHFFSREKLEDIVQQIASRCNRTVNESMPIVDARLENGARVNIVLPPVALNGPIITIRRFPDRAITMEQLIRLGSITEEATGFLEKLVRAGYNIFISGGTGSGKTTFLNALSDFIPKDERIITIEDNAELQIQKAENLVRLEAKRANAEGNAQITIRDLIKSSLRMRPDRIIVGEVRGEETIDMLTAFIFIYWLIYLLRIYSRGILGVFGICSA